MPYNIKYPSIPLADVWRGRTMHSVRIYRGAAGGDTARHTIAYYPYVRGTYDLDVRVKQTAEVQELQTTVGKGRHLGGTFKLQLTAVDKFGEVSTSTIRSPSIVTWRSPTISVLPVSRSVPFSIVSVIAITAYRTAQGLTFLREEAGAGALEWRGL